MTQLHKQEICSYLTALMDSDSIEVRYERLEKLDLPDFIIQSVDISNIPAAAAENIMTLIYDNAPYFLGQLETKIKDLPNTSGVNQV